MCRTAADEAAMGAANRDTIDKPASGLHTSVCICGRVKGCTQGDEASSCKRQAEHAQGHGHGVVQLQKSEACGRT